MQAFIQMAEWQNTRSNCYMLHVTFYFLKTYKHRVLLLMAAYGVEGDGREMILIIIILSIYYIYYNIYNI